MNKLASNDLLTVTQLIQHINTILYHNLNDVGFFGEISDIKHHRGGHIYLTIKDTKSTIRCIMWRSTYERLGSPSLREGLEVRCWGKPEVYSKLGTLAVIINKIAIGKEGSLKLKFEELKKKLEKEGLFNKDRKREIPFFPKAIGVVTSRTGAVIRDIQRKILERMPSMQIYLAPASVQGPNSAKEIVEALDLLNKSGLVDVIIVARGGGSLEELWSFNEEEVVRAIFASKIPVVSGVGHEVDVTLADLVADARASTPTAAAELVVPHRTQLHDRLTVIQETIIKSMKHLISMHAKHLLHRKEHIRRAMRDYLAHLRRDVDEMESRVSIQRFLDTIETYGIKIDLMRERIINSFDSQISAYRRVIVDKHRVIYNVCRNRVTDYEKRLQHIRGKLDGLNPTSALKRGLTIALKDGTPVRGAKHVHPGDELSFIFYDGEVLALTKKVLLNE